MRIEIIINQKTVYAGFNPADAKRAINDQMAADMTRQFQPLFDAADLVQQSREQEAMEL
jgi:hypothetical protein